MQTECVCLFLELKSVPIFMQTLHWFYAAIKASTSPMRTRAHTSPQSYFMRLADGILNDN